MKPLILGIDIGASKIVIASCNLSEKCIADVIVDSDGKRSSINCLAFTERKRLFGYAALCQAGSNIKNTIFGKDIKFLLKQDLSEDKEKDSRVFNILFQDECHALSIEETIAMILSNLKSHIDSQIPKNMYCVIPTPATYGVQQLRAIKTACEAIGLTCLKFCKNVTALSITYALENFAASPENEKSLFLLDMGTSSFEAALVRVKHAQIYIEQVISDGNLGGNDFSVRLYNFFNEQIKFELGNDLSVEQLYKLNDGCEQLKKILTFQDPAKFSIESLIEPDKNYDLKITRDKFNDLCVDLFDKFEQHLKCIPSEKYKTVDEVIVVGGALRILRLENILKSITHKEISRTLNPDESVAKGAAYLGAHLQGYFDLTLIDDEDFNEVEVDTKMVINVAKKLDWFNQIDQEEDERIEAINNLHRLYFQQKRASEALTCEMSEESKVHFKEKLSTFSKRISSILTKNESEQLERDMIYFFEENIKSYQNVQNTATVLNNPPMSEDSEDKRLSETFIFDEKKVTEEQELNKTTEDETNSKLEHLNAKHSSPKKGGVKDKILRLSKIISCDHDQAFIHINNLIRNGKLEESFAEIQTVIRENDGKTSRDTDKLTRKLKSKYIKKIEELLQNKNFDEAMTNINLCLEFFPSEAKFNEYEEKIKDLLKDKHT